MPHRYSWVCLFCDRYAVCPAQCFLYHFQLKPILYSDSWIFLAWRTTFSFWNNLNGLCIQWHHGYEHGLVRAQQIFRSKVCHGRRYCIGCLCGSKFHMCGESQTTHHPLFSHSIQLCLNINHCHGNLSTSNKGPVPIYALCLRFKLDLFTNTRCFFLQHDGAKSFHWDQSTSVPSNRRSDCLLWRHVQFLGWCPTIPPEVQSFVDCRRFYRHLLQCSSCHLQNENNPEAKLSITRNSQHLLYQ